MGIEIGWGASQKPVSSDAHFEITARLSTLAGQLFIVYPIINTFLGSTRSKPCWFLQIWGSSSSTQSRDTVRKTTGCSRTIQATSAKPGFRPAGNRCGAGIFSFQLIPFPLPSINTRLHAETSNTRSKTPPHSSKSWRSYPARALTAVTCAIKHCRRSRTSPRFPRAGSVGALRRRTPEARNWQSSRTQSQRWTTCKASPPSKRPKPKA